MLCQHFLKNAKYALSNQMLSQHFLTKCWVSTFSKFSNVYFENAKSALFQKCIKNKSAFLNNAESFILAKNAESVLFHQDKKRKTKKNHVVKQCVALKNASQMSISVFYFWLYDIMKSAQLFRFHRKTLNDKVIS